MLAIRTTEDRTPRSARPITAVSTTLRTRRVPLCSSPPGRAGSSSVAGRPRFPGEPMLPAATSGFPVPASASPYASMIGSSAAATASIPPEGSRSCLCATWMTPSESAAASLSPSRSWRSPRRTFAPSADSAAAAVSDRARPVTSCPAAMSSGMMYEPEWPVPPVTKTRTLLLLPRPITLMLSLVCLLSGAGQRRRSILDAPILAWALLSSPDVESLDRIRSGPISYLFRLPLA